MDLKTVVKSVYNKFAYRADTDFGLTGWNIMRPTKTGRLVGDSHDFVITCFWYLSGRNTFRFLRKIISGEYEVYQAFTVENQPHVFGRFEGECFDNWSPTPVKDQIFFIKTGHHHERKLSPFAFLLNMVRGLFTKR